MLWESLQQSLDDPSGFTSVQLRACSFTVVALFGVVVRTSLQADDPILVPGVPGRPGGVLTGLRGGVDRSALARAAFEGLACGVLDVVDQLLDAGVPGDTGGPVRICGPVPALGAHAQLLATLADREVIAAPAGSLAAAGACVQAAALLADAEPMELAAAWDLGAGPVVAPADDPGRLARRVLHAEERARQRRALIERG